MFEEVIRFIRSVLPGEGVIPLHAPVFSGREKELVLKCIDSTFVSSVGEFVNEFERKLCNYTGGNYAVATVNGTAALHISLVAIGTAKDDEVLTQPLSFVATSNAIAYTGARPVYIDVDKKTLGLSTGSLSEYLDAFGEIRRDGFCYNKKTGKRIIACIPMHTFGHPAEIEKIVEICSKYNIVVIEDAAESLGSYYKERHTGTFGKLGTFSFNGNKIVTSGGGGAIVTNDETLAGKIKHLTTTAKVPHAWEYIHDEIGYNYRMPNINAALLCAQMERLEEFVQNKRNLASKYAEFFDDLGIEFISEPAHAKSNYWLNTIILKDKKERNRFLEITNANGVMTRPAWQLISKLRMYADCETYNIKNSEWLADRIVNIPSSVHN